MDVAAKYRTKFPPREHEEAVRMLLEGIAGKQLQGSNLKEVSSARKNGCEFDTRSLTPSASSGSSGDVMASQMATGPDQVSALTSTLMRSKATSTTSDHSRSSSSIAEAHKEPIPSRTIAVQCDLKASSLRGDFVFDGGMQASSISSTRYGFYNYSQETLEHRRKLQRSISSRDLRDSLVEAPMASTKDHPMPISAQIEAPTSMSELSSSSSCCQSAALGDDERENRLAAHKGQIDRKLSSNFNISNLNNTTASFESRAPVKQATIRRTAVNNGGQQQLLSEHENFLPFTQEQQNNAATVPPTTRTTTTKQLHENNNTARARINSLPRRPMTALSYVSNSRLRSPHSPTNSSGPDEVDDTANFAYASMKNRAMSQQALSNRPRTPAPEQQLASHWSPSVSHSSDSELGGENSRRRGQFSDEQVDRSDEMMILKRPSVVKASNGSQPAPSKPPRPTLVSSVHNEQVRDYKTLERIPTSRSTQLQSDRARQSGRTIGTWKAPVQRENDSLRDSRTYSGSTRFLSSSNDTEGYNNENLNPHLSEASISSGRRKAVEQMRESSLDRDKSFIHQNVPAVRHINSMSLSRRPKHATGNHYLLAEHHGGQLSAGESAGYYTSSRRPQTLSRNDRARSQTQLTRPPLAARVDTVLRSRQPSGPGAAPDAPAFPTNDVSRSTSMRHISRLGGDPSYVCTEPAVKEKRSQRYVSGESGRGQDNSTLIRDASNKYKNLLRNESDDSESPSTRTWANPNARLPSDTNTLNHHTNNHSSKLMRNRKSPRSCSMRDVNHNGIDVDAMPEALRFGNTCFRAQKNDFSSYSSTGSDSSGLDCGPRFIRSHELDYDSQHRLNESGLPEVTDQTAAAYRPSATSSYIGTPLSLSASRDVQPLTTQHTANTGRSSQIRGRAMSQQSLTRPTMPLTTGRRRGGSNPGSDVGGSSMSLVSRLHGRYENAHTRTPVVMYIPQVPPKPCSDEGLAGGIGKSSLLRKSSRARYKSSSQDRSRRNSSRNGSDSETSSMLRTLVRPRGRAGNFASTKRTSRIQGMMLDHDDDEDMDGIGQLATEMDSYKFRRRYSVPKDAKINWFAKLRQRVTSGGR